MLVDQLPEKIEKALSQGKRIKFIYTIPNFHNPLGCTMSLERRKKLVEIANKYGIAILEDDPYAYIRFEGEDLPTLFSLDQSGLVVHACTFSKILAPGTRVAWAVGNKEIIRKMAIFKQGIDLCSSVVAQALVYEYCRKGHLDSYGEDGNYEAKKEVLEKLDSLIPKVLELKPDVLVVTGDHSTPSQLKSHSWHPVPVLLVSPYVRHGNCSGFGERECAKGALGIMPAHHLMGLMLAHGLRLSKYGA